MGFSQRRSLFLQNMRSTGKARYRRYTGSPIRYAGGKSLAVGHIVACLPDGLTKLVSPFMGGGSLEIACAVELDLPVVGYDIFAPLMTYWEQQLSNPEQLAATLMTLEPTKERFAAVKTRLRQHWEGTALLTPAETLAAYFVYNHNLSYGPGFLGWMSSVYADQVRYERFVERVRRFRAPNLTVACAGFEEVIPRHSGDFLYCDPPYLLDASSSVFHGIYPSRNIDIYHRGFKHEALRALLTRHEGGFILSYNDCVQVREWYAAYPIVEVAWQYTYGQGDTRIGTTRQDRSDAHVKRSRELLIIGER